MGHRRHSGRSMSFMKRERCDYLSITSLSFFLSLSILHKNGPVFQSPFHLLLDDDDDDTDDCTVARCSGTAITHSQREAVAQPAWNHHTTRSPTKIHVCSWFGLLSSTRTLTQNPRWVFWFRQQRAPGNKIISYEEGIKHIAKVNSVRTDAPFLLPCRLISSSRSNRFGPFGHISSLRRLSSLPPTICSSTKGCAGLSGRTR